MNIFKTFEENTSEHIKILGDDVNIPKEYVKALKDNVEKLGNDVSLILKLLESQSN